MLARHTQPHTMEKECAIRVLFAAFDRAKREYSIYGIQRFEKGVEGAGCMQIRINHLPQSLRLLLLSMIKL